MTLAKLYGYHAYTTMARFVRNHSYRPPLLGAPTYPVAIPSATLCVILMSSDMSVLEHIRCSGARQFLCYAAKGKTLGGSADVLKGQKATHLLSFVHQRYRSTVAQQQVSGKRNEISTAKSLLGGLNSTGMLITADALLTHKGFTAVIEQQGRYLLLVKENQQQPQELLAEVFREGLPSPAFCNHPPDE